MFASSVVSPGSNGKLLEKLCQFRVVHHNGIDEFCSESGHIKVNWLELLELLILYPYSVIPEELKVNPISEGFRCKLDPKAHGTGKLLLSTYQSLNYSVWQYN